MSVIYAFFLVAPLITKSVAIISTRPIGNTMYQFCTKPAITYVTNDTAATVKA